MQTDAVDIAPDRHLAPDRSAYFVVSGVSAFAATVLLTGRRGVA